MFVCVAGKNNIAVSVLEHLVENQQERYELGIVCNKTETGKNGWQKSLRWYAQKYNIREYSLEEVYNIPKLVFLSMEFDQLIRPDLFIDARLYNIHFSALPAYKGMYTSVFPILNGEKESGVTFHEIDAGIDTGNIIKQIKFELKEEYNCRDLYLQYIKHGIKLVKECLQDVIEDKLTSYRQSAENSTYYSRKMIDYKNITIDLIQTADNIRKQIRAYNFREYQLPTVFGKKIIDAKITNAKSVHRPGTIIKENEQGMILATIDYDIELYYDRFEELLDACQDGDLAKVTEICSVKRHINEKNANGWSAVIVATYYNRREIVEFLLANGADPYDVNFNGTNLLMYAKEAYLLTGDNSLFKLFYQYGLNEYDTDFQGNGLIYYINKNGICLKELLYDEEK